MATVRTLVLRAPGSNCDGETAFAFQKAGAEVTLVHVNRLLGGEERLSDYQILAIPGGFTYGDDIAAGKVLANELRLKMGDDIRRFVARGGLIIGICNGFQVMVRAGILPEPEMSDNLRTTLTTNDSGKFECRWVYLGVAESPCVFTRGIERMYLPIAHGEGKFITEEKLLPEIHPAVYYTDAQGNRGAGYPSNPNGSMADIAGICDSSGRIFALMPHPERHIRGTQHPRWTREGIKETGDGFQVFLNAVDWAKKS